MAAAATKIVIISEFGTFRHDGSVSWALYQIWFKINGDL